MLSAESHVAANTNTGQWQAPNIPNSSHVIVHSLIW